MLIFRRKLSNGFFTKKSYSVQPSIEGQKNRKNTQHTILLPKTTFPAYLKPEEVAERDRRVLKVFLKFFII